MQFKQEAQVLDKIARDYELDSGKKGVSHKLQVLVKSGEKYTTHLCKYNTERINPSEVQVGATYNFTFELQEYGKEKELTLSIVDVD